MEAQYISWGQVPAHSRLIFGSSDPFGPRRNSSGMRSWLVQRGWQVVQGEMGVGILQGRRVGKGVELPGLLGFVPRRKRQIIRVPDLQWFVLQTRSLCCSFRWVLPQLILLGVPKGLPLCIQVLDSRFRRRKQQFRVAIHFVTTYEQKEDKLPVLVFGTEQVDL